MTKFETWMEFQNAVEPENQGMAQIDPGAGVDDIKIRQVVKTDLHRLFTHLNHVNPTKLAQIIAEIAKQFTAELGLNKNRLLRTVRGAIA